jgi:hypothetical protein
VSVSCACSAVCQTCSVHQDLSASPMLSGGGVLLTIDAGAGAACRVQAVSSPVKTLQLCPAALCLIRHWVGLLPCLNAVILIGGAVLLLLLVCSRPHWHLWRQGSCLIGDGTCIVGQGTRCGASWPVVRLI